MLLVTASDFSPTPFKGGLLVPVRIAATLPMATGISGDLQLPWSTWPAGLSGQNLYFQAAIMDAAAVKGVALSNALEAKVP